jgi:hypothetical protein
MILVRNISNKLNHYIIWAEWPQVSKTAKLDSELNDFLDLLHVTTNYRIGYLVP